MFSLTRTLSRSFQSVTAKKRKEVLAVRTSYRKEVLALLSCNCKEVLAVSRTQAQVTAISRKKNVFLRMQKEVLAHALFLGCTVTINRARNCDSLVVNAPKIEHWRLNFQNWSPAGELQKLQGNHTLTFVFKSSC